MELACLQLGLVLLAAYFAIGVGTVRAYAWPLLMGPGPFFSLFCLYLATQLQRRARHLYGLVQFATVYSIPYATLALVGGHSSRGGPFHIGDLPPILLTVTLALRLRAWRRLFDAPLAEGLDERRALLVEVFAGFGSSCVVLTSLTLMERVRDWARASDPENLIPTALYIVILMRLMIVPALVATVIGWGLHRSRGTTAWIRGALAFVIVMAVIHGGMQLVFANDLCSRLAGGSWTVVLVGFAVWVHRWQRKHPPAPLPGAPQVF